MPVIKYDILNTFTSIPFAGNQCAVVILTAENAILSDEMLQKIAAEFSLPMTCFLYPISPGPTTLRYRIRWFTTTIETPLCGHAVLAATHILLASTVANEASVVNFESLWGPLSATKMVGGKIGLEFPAPAAKAISEENMAKAEEVLNEALGRTVDIIGVKDVGFYLILHIAATFDLEGAIVNTQAFLELPFGGIILTSNRHVEGSPEHGYIARVFAPSIGIPEDNFSGSAHTALAPYWSSVLNIPSGVPIHARQVSRRGGNLELSYDKENVKVRMSGNTVVVASGEMYF